MPSLKSTLPQKIVGSKTTTLFGKSYFRGYVSLWGVYICLVPLAAVETSRHFPLNSLSTWTAWTQQPESLKEWASKNVRHSEWRTWNKISQFWADFQVEITPPVRFINTTETHTSPKGHAWKCIHLWLNFMGWHQLDVRRTYPNVNTWAWQGPTPNGQFFRQFSFRFLRLAATRLKQGQTGKTEFFLWWWTIPQRVKCVVYSPALQGRYGLKEIPCCK